MGALAAPYGTASGSDRIEHSKSGKTATGELNVGSGRYRSRFCTHDCPDGCVATNIRANLSGFLGQHFPHNKTNANKTLSPSGK